MRSAHAHGKCAATDQVQVSGRSSPTREPCDVGAPTRRFGPADLDLARLPERAALCSRAGRLPGPRSQPICTWAGGGRPGLVLSDAMP